MFSIRGESRESFHPPFCRKKSIDNYFMPTDIIEDNVGLAVIDFYTVGVGSMKVLFDVVCGESDVSPRWMPRWINQGRYGLVGFGIQFLHLLTRNDVRTCMGRTLVKQHLVRVLHTE